MSSATTPRILLVDDDVEFCSLVTDYLTSMGFDVHAVHRGNRALERITDESWHAVVLDVMMPGMDGFEVLKEIRKTSSLPVLMLTGRGDETDVIVGLEVGADDYLPKTASMRELLARLRAVLRRTSAAAEAPSDYEPDVVVGELRISPSTRAAFLGEEAVELTPVEFSVLYVLGRDRGRVKTRDALLREIRDRDYEVSDRSIDVHISSLRKKLGDDPKEPTFLRTYRSAGYMLIDPDRD